MFSGGVFTTNSAVETSGVNSYLLLNENQYSFVLQPETTDDGDFLFKFYITDPVITNSYLHGQVSTKLFNSSGLLKIHSLESCMCLIPSTIPSTPYFDSVNQDYYTSVFTIPGISGSVSSKCSLDQAAPLFDGETYNVEITFTSSNGFYLIKESFVYDSSLFD